MKIKMSLAAFALAVAPGFAMAMCQGDHVKTSSQCGDGMVWDSVLQSCKTPVHS